MLLLLEHENLVNVWVCRSLATIELFGIPRLLLILRLQHGEKASEQLSPIEDARVVGTNNRQRKNPHEDYERDLGDRELGFPWGGERWSGEEGYEGEDEKTE